MNTVLGILVIAVGLLAVLANRRFGEASVESSRTFFRLNLEGKPRRFMIAWSRTIAVIVGAFMIVGGVVFLFRA